MNEVTEDRVLDGRIALRQPARGYRAGLDAALLAAAIDAAPGARVVEAGCGAGGALLAAAARHPGVSFTGVERDVAALELARQNIALNSLSDRVQVVEGDVALRFAGLGLEPFDAAMANPPFFDDSSTLRGPAPERRAAWIADDGLAAWINFLTKGVREGGSITVIHRADRLADLMSLFAEKCGSIQVLPVHPFAEAPAKRILVRAIKSGKAPLKLLPGLVLHGGDEAKHTPRAEAIMRGEAALSWG